jgi:hypothetical protein
LAASGLMQLRLSYVKTAWCGVYFAELVRTHPTIG